MVVTRRYGVLGRRGFGAAGEAGWITGANVMVDGGMSSIDGAEPVIVTPTS
jgi:hypothetical protein